MIELPKAQDKAQALTGLCEFLVEIEETTVVLRSFQKLIKEQI